MDIPRTGQVMPKSSARSGPRPGTAPQKPLVVSPATADRLQCLLVVGPGPDPIIRARLRAEVARVLAEEGESGPWSDPEGHCLDLAAKWMARLQAAGFPAVLTIVDPAQRQPGTRIAAGETGKFHAFLTLDTGRGPLLIVDGSWRQFISGAASRQDLPEVFVGTSQELRKAFGRERNNLRLEIHDDHYLGRRHPDRLVDLAYGEGAHAALRSRVTETGAP